MDAYCTGCNRTFPVTMREESQGGGAIKILFSCTHCGKAYEVAYLSKRAVAVRDEYHRSKARYGNTRRTRRLLEVYQRLYVGLSAANT